MNKKLLLFLLFYSVIKFALTINFQPVLDVYSASENNIVISQATIDGEPLKKGDEIALFINDMCISAYTLTNDFKADIFLNLPQIDDLEKIIPEMKAISFQYWINDLNLLVDDILFYSDSPVQSLRNLYDFKHFLLSGLINKAQVSEVYFELDKQNKGLYLRNDTPGAKIFYSSFNDAYVSDYLHYRNKSVLPKSKIIKAFAKKDNYIDSFVSKFNFELDDKSENLSKNHFYAPENKSHNNSMMIYLSSIDLDDFILSLNDEVAVFDGDICVAVYKITNIDETLHSFIVSKDSSSQSLNGYTPGNKIQFKIWDDSKQKELVEKNDFQVLYLTGEAYFQDSSTSMVVIRELEMLEEVKFSHSDEIYSSQIELILSHQQEDVNIYYTLDGTEPDENSLVYINPVLLTERNDYEIKARAYKNGYKRSPVKSVNLSINGKLNDISFNNFSGIYYESFYLELFFTDDDIKVYYTLDGSEPDSTKNLYHDFIEINQSCTVKSIALKENWENSNIAVADFVILFSPDNLSGYSIADQAFLQWDEPLFINANLLEYAIYRKLNADTQFSLISKIPASETSFIDNELNSGIYNYSVVAVYEQGESNKATEITIQIDQVSPPMFSPTPGFYQNQIFVNIFTVTDGAKIFYTLDGSIPDSTSTEFIEPFFVGLDSTLVIKTIAYKNSYIPSFSSTGVFTTTGMLPEPVFLYGEGIYEDQVLISFESLPDDIEIRYTFDNSSVTQESPLYNGPLIITESTVVRAKTFKSHWISPDEVIQEFVIANVPEQLESFVNRDSVYISWKEPLMIRNNDYNLYNRSLLGYLVYLRIIDMANPDEIIYEQMTSDLISETNYSLNALLEASYQVFVLAVYDGNSVSASKAVNFSVNKTSEPLLLAEPGIYYEPVEISLHHDYATVFYTLDGAEPTQNSILYNSPIRIKNKESLSIRYRAFYQNYIPSEIKSASFSVTGKVIPPLLSVPTGTYSLPFNLEIFCETEDVVIYYTIDGSVPDSTSLVYVSPISVSETKTIRALAKKKNWRSSDVVTVYYDFLSDEMDIPELLFSTKLNNAYPNPFNSKTNIPFTLENASSVEIDIYNLLGQKIITLYSGKKGKGEHTVSWNGRDETGKEVAGGVYFSRMRTPDYSHMVKIVYVK